MEKTLESQFQPRVWQSQNCKDTDARNQQLQGECSFSSLPTPGLGVLSLMLKGARFQGNALFRVLRQAQILAVLQLLSLHYWSNSCNVKMFTDSRFWDDGKREASVSEWELTAVSLILETSIFKRWHSSNGPGDVLPRVSEPPSTQQPLHWHWSTVDGRGFGMEPWNFCLWESCVFHNALPLPSLKKSYLHRIIEQFGLEGTFKGHLVQPPAMSNDIFSWIGCSEPHPTLSLNVSSEGACTTSLGNPFQCFTTFIIKKISSL